MQASHRARVQIPVAPIPIQLPGTEPGKAAEDGLSTWSPATHMENLKEDPGSRLMPDNSPTHCGHLGSE